MSENIDTMLDPSLFADNSYESSFEMIDDLGSECKFTVSQSFSKLLQQGNLISEEPVREFFSSYSSFYEHEKMETLFSDADVTTFSAGNYVEEYEPYYRTIAQGVLDRNRYTGSYGEGSVLVDILFDEFVFSIENSPILSRLKKIKERFKNAIAYTIEPSENLLDENWKNLEEIVGGKIKNFRQIKEELRKNAEDRLDEDHPVVLSTYLRQAVKDYAPNWIIDISENELPLVVGGAIGGAIGATAAGPIGGAAGGAVGGLGTKELERFVMYVADP